MYTIGEFAKKANVTIRALRYYEEVGLLQPSGVTEGKHRLYSDEDFIQLQQILMLKHLGFPLKKIKEMLEKKDWEQSLQTQIKLVNLEIDRLTKISQGLKSILRVLQTEKRVNWEVLLKLFSYAKRDPKERLQFIEQNLSEQEAELLKTLPKMEDDSPENLRLIEILGKVIAHKDLDPASPQAQQVLKELWDHTFPLFDYDLEKVDLYWNMQQNHAEDLSLYPFDQKTLEFIEKGMLILRKEMGLE
jgi:DNA-binding transcriptional MerR regulator